MYSITRPAIIATIATDIKNIGFVKSIIEPLANFIIPPRALPAAALPIAISFTPAALAFVPIDLIPVTAEATAFLPKLTSAVPAFLAEAFTLSIAYMALSFIVSRPETIFAYTFLGSKNLNALATLSRFPLTTNSANFPTLAIVPRPRRKGKIRAATLRRAWPIPLASILFKKLRPLLRTPKNTSTDPLSVTNFTNFAISIANSLIATIAPPRSIVLRISTASPRLSKKVPKAGSSAKLINPPRILPKRSRSFVPFFAAPAKNSLRGFPSIVFRFLKFSVIFLK